MIKTNLLAISESVEIDRDPSGDDRSKGGYDGSLFVPKGQNRRRKDGRIGGKVTNGRKYILACSQEEIPHGDDISYV